MVANAFLPKALKDFHTADLRRYSKSKEKLNSGPGGEFLTRACQTLNASFGEISVYTEVVTES